MPRFYITDETNDSRTADVLASGAVEVAPVYDYYFVNSGTGTAQIHGGAALLHSVTIAETAAAASMITISNNLSAEAVADVVGSSASAVAVIPNSTRNTYLFDCYCDTGLAYRLSGIECNGITITYQAM